MSIRKAFFWLHLIFGCIAALFIFLMSATGALLTYERQIIHFAEKSDYPQANHHTNTLSLTALSEIAKTLAHEKPLTISLRKEENAFVQVKEGRKTLAYLNPYTGEKIDEPGLATKTFMRKLRAFHRWLTLDGNFSETGRWVNGIANLMFFVLVLSGLYLWLPKRFNKRAFKQKLTFGKSYPNINARDYQWHNVYGIYLAPVLAVVIATAFFFSFKWPGNTLKEVISNEAKVEKLTAMPLNQGTAQSLDVLFKNAIGHTPDWQQAQFSLPKTPMDKLAFSLDTGTGGEPQKRLTVTVDTQTGAVLQILTFDDLSTYRKARSYIRFLHTGEAYGIFGQTIAGLASLLACLLVYTGVMLSWRRWQNYRLRKAKLALEAA
ncbi:PepSY-associated TM helix domain-containing protein [Pseudoalteromonas sp. SSM20]|uniref:PepSY-associated TM helix domain-containing protein n=1 Tax=Pseudoalteromonas sp. SSM20 TaxID=3139394 RepID=UPI003BAD9A2D